MKRPHSPILSALTKADIERFWSRVDKRGPDDCWLFTGGGHPYGTFAPLGKAPRAAHRVSWALNAGREIAADRIICHTCDSLPPSQRSKIALEAWNKGCAEIDRRAQERRAKWLQRMGMTWEEWLASPSRAQRIATGAATIAAKRKREREAMMAKYPWAFQSRSARR